MTSKERVIATINHQEPDRVPIGEWGIDHDHVSHIIGKHTFWRNRKDTTLALWENRRDEIVESLKEDYCKLVETLDYDIVTVDLVPPKNHFIEDPPRAIGEGLWADKHGNVFKYAASNDSIMQIQYGAEAPQFKDTLDEEDLEKAWEQVNQFDDSRFELLDYIADKYAGERAVLCRDMDIYSQLMNPFHGNYEENLILSITAPDEIKKLYDVCAAYNHHLIEHCQAKGVTLIMQGQDFGMNTGCILSPNSIRELYVPMMKRVNADAVEHNLIPFYHCCGNIWDIMDDFVEAGYRGYQSIQESAGMDTRKVKRLYGGKLALWTGVQCETLVQGTRAELEKEVFGNLEFLMPGGGFIFGSTNSVQYGAKTENYLRALEIVRREGIY